jgi:anti-anti-sigma factor
MTVTKKLESKLDVEAALVLHATLLPELQSGQDIVLDCTAVDMCGAAAAQVLISFSKALQASGHALTLQSVPENLRTDLSLLGLEEFFSGGLHV